MRLTEVSILRPVATTMVYLMLIVLGIVSFRSLPIDLLPKVEFTQLTVRVNYPNVGPEEVEQIITDRIENAVAGLPNLERVTSQSEEGSSRVRLEFARGTNIDEAANDRSRVRPAPVEKHRWLRSCSLRLSRFLEKPCRLRSGCRQGDLPGTDGCRGKPARQPRPRHRKY